MIRDLTKSATSFSWALSLLGLKQAANLLTPGQQGGDLFAPMTQVAVNELDESMKGFFRSGDSLQSRMVDMTFSMMNPINWFNPGAWQNMGSWANPANWMGPMTNFTRAATGGCRGQGPMRSQAPAASAGPTASGAPMPPTGTPPSASGAPPISNQSAAAGWGSMPGN